MAEKTTNYNLTKPSAEDFYDINVQNDNMDIIDEQLKASADNLTVHSNATNPHKITAATVGLGNVPNVATNDQTPTYTEASTLATLTSGEKMSVAFGKIKKAITDLISHLSDTTKHNSSTSGVTIGNNSQLVQNNNNGVAIGNGSLTKNGVSIGYNAKGNDGVSIGYGAEGNGVSIGYNAKAKSNGVIDAIQLGTGTNANAKTLQVYNYQLMDANGVIPKGRMYGLLKTISFTTPLSRTSTTSGNGERFNTQLTGVDFSAYDDILFVINGTITYPAAGSTGTSNNNIYAYFTSETDKDGVVFAYFTQQHSTTGQTLNLTNYTVELKKSNYAEISTSGSNVYKTYLTKCATHKTSVIAFTDDIYIGFRIANPNIATYTVTPNLTISIYGRGGI